MTEAQVAEVGPHSQFDPRLESRLARVGSVVRVATAVYAAGVALDRLTGLLGILVFKGVAASRMITSLAALGLAVLAIAAALSAATRKSQARVRLMGMGLAVASMATGLWASANALALTVGFDLMPSYEVPSLATGLSLVILGTAVVLSIDRRESRVMVAQSACVLVFSLTAVVLAEFALGDAALGSFLTGPEESLQAAIIALAASVGIFLIRPGSGILSRVSSPGPGGRMLRRYGLPVLLAPAVLISLAQATSPSARIDALATVAVMLGLFLLALMAVMVRTVDESAVEASTAEAVARRARVGLQQAAPVVADLAGELHLVEVGDSENWDIATRFRPAAGMVAGDASIVRPLPEGRMVVVLVDVTGHGAEPALHAVRLRDRLAHGTALLGDPAAALATSGSLFPGEEMASAVVVLMDMDSGEVVMASAGHPPAIYLSAAGRELLGPTGPLLFADPEAAYDKQAIELEPGDSLVLFSDGVADVQRMKRGRTEPEILADLLMAEGGDAGRGAELVMGFSPGEPADDQSVVYLRRRA